MSSRGNRFIRTKEREVELMDRNDTVEITEDDFARMKARDQMLVIFKNTSAMRETVERLRFSQRLHYKVQYISIGALGSLAVFTAIELFKHSAGG